MNQLIEQKFLALFDQQWGKKADRTEMLPASGSARKYWRIYWNGESCIAAWNRNVEENRLFIDFSRHFAEKGLHVPQIYAVSEDRKVYLQEDLGTQTLLDVVGQERKGNSLSEHSMQLYRKSLSELLRFQLIGGQGLDYARCVPRPVFDRQCILWDLNYFKYCFLKLAGADFSEQALEDDFIRLTDALVQEPADSFMFRDFQSRNIMVRAGEVWFIDYQGGRQGALPYDVASLLYDAIVAIPDEQREELLDGYICGLQAYRTVEPGLFRHAFYRFVLVRLLQAMGAFGLRGLYERKPHFIDSIQPGLHNIDRLFQSGRLGADYAEIRRVCRQLLE